MSQKPLTTGEIAKYCHVTYRTVLKWVASGKLKAYRTPGHHSRVHVDDFLKFLRTYKMPVPPELKYNYTLTRILVVEDDKGMAKAIGRVLRSEPDFQVEITYDGFTAGRKFAEFKPDLIVLDVNMPGIDGYQLCHDIRSQEEHSRAAILAVSGLGGEEVESKMLELGADAFLAKPFSNSELMDVIQSLIKARG